MTIKPVLVPDHTANDLRRLMDHFAEATTGPTKRQLNESRAAVAAAQGVSESSHDVDHMPGATRNDLSKDMQAGCKRCGGHRHIYKDETGKVSQNNFPGAKKYKCGACSKPGVADDGRKQQFRGTGNAGMPRTDDDGNVLEQGVAEDKPDVMRHTGDKTVKVVKRRGVPIGEIGLDTGYGEESYYVKLYDGSYDAAGFDTAAEALQELKAAIKQMSEGVTEGEGMSRAAKGYAESGVEDDEEDDPFTPSGKMNDWDYDVENPLRKNNDEEEHDEVCPECDGAGHDRGKSIRKWRKTRGFDESEMEEGWKQKVAGAALAGAAALGAGGAQAQTTDKYDPDWNSHSMTHHIRSDVSSTKSMNSADPSKNTHDFQKRIQNVTGPNAKGEYKVVVMQGNDIVSHYVTKTPPPGWLYKEGEEQQVHEKSEAVRHANNRHDHRDAGHVDESIDPIEQLRADIKRFAQ